MLHNRIPSLLTVALALQSAGCGDDSGDFADSASSSSSTSATGDTTVDPPPPIGSTSLDESASGTASESGATDGVTSTTGTSEPPPLSTGEPDTMTSGEPGTTTTTSGEPDSTTTTSGEPDSTTTTTGEPDTTTTTGDTTTTTTTGDTTTTTGEPDTTTTESTTGEVIDCSDGVAWTRNILTNAGSTMFDDILADPDGNLLVAGRLWSVADFGDGPVQSSGPEDAFIAKYGPTGDLLWVRTYGNEYEQRARGLALAPNGDILVTGSFRGQIDLGGGPFVSAGYEDVFLARLTSAGEHVWSHAFGSQGLDHGLRVASDGAGDVILAVQADAGIDFGDGVPGPDDSVHLAKFSSAGALLWRRTYTAKGLLGRSVAVDPADEVVFVGEFNKPVDFGGGLDSPLAGNNVFVLKLDADGQFIWLRQNAGTPSGGKPFVTGVDIDAAGAIHLAGWYWGSIGFGGPLLFSQGGFDGWIAALSPAGDHLTSSVHGSGPTHWQFASDIATNSAGVTAVAGNFVGPMSFGDTLLATVDNDSYDAWVTRQAPDASFELVRGFGGLGSQYGDVVDLGEDGSVWLGGVYSHPFPAGDDVLTPAEGWSAYLLRLCP
ncbi:hypothetical protein OV090_45695 [Nannocystis sp. RBIL2]|uniref:hypothetical protein n=1 Tax=Nannocystis sp. RBIL2 TaxID=2996788 RepID=UPI002270EE8F|nr:hypothetical protein [Nannocystis sp. RBIL2]MCY1072126.1 hypothetical protein [Nannocystis sp. RBIL2]